MPKLSLRARMQLAGLAAKAAVGLLTPSSAEDAYGLLARIYPAKRGDPPPRTTQDFLRAYKTMPWLRAAVNRVAHSVASTTWRAYAVQRGSKYVQVRGVQRADATHRRKMLGQLKAAGTLVEIEAHPIIDLIDNPMPFMTGIPARKLAHVHFETVGETFWIKERNAYGTRQRGGRGMPVQLWPIPPHWVRSTPTPQHPFYEIRWSGWQGDIPDTEIMWLAEPDPEFPYGRGAGIAQVLADELDTDEYAAKHTKSWFYNRARPDILISPKGTNDSDTIGETEVRRMEQSWLQKHSGFWRAFKPHFASRAIDVKELSHTFENMQLVQLREFERNTIVQVFGIPPEMLGILNDSNRATIENAEYLFSKWVLVPRLEVLREFYQERLVPEFDERIILDYDSPVAEDKEFHLKAMQAAPWAPSADEWRAVQGLDELEDKRAGSVHLVPVNVTAHESLADVGATDDDNEPDPGEDAPPAL